MKEINEDELNSLEGKCMEGNSIYCSDCPFASIELCNNQCLEVTESEQ